jgi:putative ABC transport system substrate-binding protein
MAGTGPAGLALGPAGSACATIGTLRASTPAKKNGGLMSYASDFGELGRRIAEDVHQILKGAKPADIPIYQPTKFEFVINLKAAKALDLTIRRGILALADEVIE